MKHDFCVRNELHVCDYIKDAYITGRNDAIQEIEYVFTKLYGSKKDFQKILEQLKEHKNE